ncbi:MAG: DNA repair protein RadA [Rhodothermales bacterium]|nr:DNA repair protein RadA [Rhodothermales bacterium]
MPKVKTVYFCQSCGHESQKWLGQCPSCGDWNSYLEEFKAPTTRQPVTPRQSASAPVALRDVSLDSETRISTGTPEFDRVLGGGIVPGSMVLVAGDPGIGKSTLLTELAKYQPDRTILYVTGEESVRQVKMRAERIHVAGDNLTLLSETSTEAIIRAADKLNPDIVILDSIQSVFIGQVQSAPGSVSQIRESTSALLQFAKDRNIATFLIGHVTKTGSIAGPRVLEHMVDTVLYLEGDRHAAYRILRAVKNRFGSTNEIGVFTLGQDGLRPVDNASELFLSERNESSSGSVVVCSMEGTRPLLVEIQALVADTAYGTPQRATTGFDGRRLQMLLAVLEKREGIRCGAFDIFVNVAGGVRLVEPAVDLGVISAIVSSLRDKPVGGRTVVSGEVGLGGELRAVSHVTRRVNEAENLGFERIIVPSRNVKEVDKSSKIELYGPDSLHQALDILF